MILFAAKSIIAPQTDGCVSLAPAADYRVRQAAAKAHNKIAGRRKQGAPEIFFVNSLAVEHSLRECLQGS